MRIRKIIKLIHGYRTYIIGAIVVVLGFLQGMDIFTVPEAVWPVLGGLGLAAMRAGINSVAKTVKPPDGVLYDTTDK